MTDNSEAVRPRDLIRPRGTRYHIEHDGFEGQVIGDYERTDGKQGVVLQQDGNVVTHVYGEKWLGSPLASAPTPPHVVTEGGRVRVKELAWGRPDAELGLLARADTILGSYRVWTRSEAAGRWFWSLSDSPAHNGGSLGTKGEAKSAAQADYESRVLSTLEPAPTTTGTWQSGIEAETQRTINDWITATFGEAGSNMSVAARANQEMAELIMGLAVNDADEHSVEEAADIVIILYRLAERFGKDLHAEVARKMQVNRARKWNVANGHGYHVKDDTPPTPMPEPAPAGVSAERVEAGFPLADYAVVAELLTNGTEAVRKAALSNNFNIILSALRRAAVTL